MNIEGEKFIYHNTEELITILEGQFNEFGDIVQKLFESNKEMLKFDPNDYDLIQARQENLQIIQIKLKLMKEIQGKIKNIYPHHPIVKVDIFSLFIKNDDNKNKDDDNDINNNIKNEEEKKQDELILNMINEIPSQNNSNNNNFENNNHNKENEIITEIEL